MDVKYINGGQIGGYGMNLGLVVVSKYEKESTLSRNIHCNQFVNFNAELVGRSGYLRRIYVESNIGCRCSHNQSIVSSAALGFNAGCGESRTFNKRCSWV